MATLVYPLHISHRGREGIEMGSLEVAKGASWVKLKIERERVPTAKVPSGRNHGGARGVVRGFSRGSRRRLLSTLNKVSKTHLQSALFVTLTYPGVWPDAWERWKRDLDAMGKRIRRQFPGCSFVWRLEYQRRGAPHFHLMLFGVPFVPASWLARSWYEIVGSGDSRHLAAGTEVRRVRNFRSVIGYAAKYLAKGKSDDDARTDGRVWGVVGRSDLPIEIVGVTLSAQAFYKMRRYLRKWVEGKTHKKWFSARGKFDGITVYFLSDEALRLLGQVLVECG